MTSSAHRVFDTALQQGDTLNDAVNKAMHWFAGSSHGYHKRYDKPKKRSTSASELAWDEAHQDAAMNARRFMTPGEVSR